MKGDIMRIIFLVLTAGILAGCQIFSGSPENNWVEAQRVYNASLRQFVENRTPCVPTTANEDFGPDHPRCLISDELYNKIEPVRKTAYQCLQDADTAITTGNESDAEIYISCAQGAAIALSEYIN